MLESFWVTKLWKKGDQPSIRHASKPECPEHPFKAISRVPKTIDVAFRIPATAQRGGEPRVSSLHCEHCVFIFPENVIPPSKWKPSLCENPSCIHEVKAASRVREPIGETFRTPHLLAKTVERSSCDATGGPEGRTGERTVRADGRTGGRTNGWAVEHLPQRFWDSFRAVPECQD